ncbi:hypothetical protein PG993_012150 [Apiospora rasikravindrae]|uniref:Uncharacterized protein n=1 Tax=Apiospora rasikravindrae TaxID=990691 RepID=A0ABR1S1M4_9PEZI
MPASTTTAKPVGTKRFQLPALDFHFGSLTDGTNIPPPIPSPVQEVPTPPKTPTPAADVGGEKKEPNGAANGPVVERNISPPPEPVHTTTITAGVKRAADDVPASPTLSSRGSLRRLLSKNLLHNTYDDHASIAESRPPSRTASVVTEERKSKRSSGWFRRLRSNNNSVAEQHTLQPPAPPLFDEAPQKKPSGPPPPKIPELSALQTKIDTSMGDDLFKEIK